MVMTEEQKSTQNSDTGRRFDLRSMPQCIFMKGDVPCHKRGSRTSPYCNHHRPKLAQIKFTEIEKLSVETATELINQKLQTMKRADDIDKDDVIGLNYLLTVVKTGTELSLKEQVLVDAQTKLNNAIKKIASVLQEEIKSAPLFERIINKIIAIDLNETTTEVKKKIKASVVATPVIDKTSETDDSAPADNTPAESSLNTESQDIQP